MAKRSKDYKSRSKSKPESKLKQRGFKSNVILAGSIFLKVIFYPIFYCIEMVATFRSKQSAIAKFLASLFLTIFLFIWIGVALGISTYANAIELAFLGGTTATLIEEGDINPDELRYTTSSGGSSSTSSGGAVSYDGTQYTIDLSKINSSTTVSLPSGTWQNGTVQQRAEILMIVQEICARPEITISPQELLGIWYSETTANIGCSGSVLTTTWPVTYNAYDCGGPFQHKRSAWEADGEYRGYAFISSLEDPNLSDDDRVKTSDNCTKTINGLQRPSMFCFSDAAYSAARRYSNTYSDKLGNDSHWTKDMLEWADTNGMDDYQKTILRNVASCGYYNGYTDSVKTFIPSMYVDIYKQYGKLDQWSNLAVSRENLNTKLRSLASSTTRVTSNFQGGGTADYATSVANGIWQSTQFVFVAYNGGKYVYDGLIDMAKQLGATETGSNPESSSSNINIDIDTSNLTEWQQKAVQVAISNKNNEKWIVNGESQNSNISCYAFVRRLWRMSGKWDLNSQNYCDELLANSCGDMVIVRFADKPTLDIDWSKVPVGAGLISSGSPVYYRNGTVDNRDPNHVSFYVGDGKIVEAGGETVNYSAAENGIGFKRQTGYYGWAMPKALYDTLPKN